MKKSTPWKRGFCLLRSEKPLPALPRSASSFPSSTPRRSSTLSTFPPPHSLSSSCLCFCSQEKKTKSPARNRRPLHRRSFWVLLPAKDQPAGVGKPSQGPVRVPSHRRISCLLGGFRRREMVVPAAGPVVARSVLVFGLVAGCTLAWVVRRAVVFSPFMCA
jgi:hypothetical protein